MKIFGWEETYPYNAKEKADRILEECSDICKELKLNLCLLMGTCLGIVRDGKYIEGDNDLDIGINCSEDDCLSYIERLIKNGFIRDGISSHFYKYGILIDLFHIMPEKAYFFKSFDSITYNGRVYDIPHPVEEYLKNFYGDWKTPKSKNPQNVY